MLCKILSRIEFSAVAIKSHPLLARVHCQSKKRNGLICSLKTDRSGIEIFVMKALKGNTIVIINPLKCARISFTRMCGCR